MNLIYLSTDNFHREYKFVIIFTTKTEEGGWDNDRSSNFWAAGCAECCVFAPHVLEFYMMI